MSYYYFQTSENDFQNEGIFSDAPFYRRNSDFGFLELKEEPTNPYTQSPAGYHLESETPGNPDECNQYQEMAQIIETQTPPKSSAQEHVTPGGPCDIESTPGNPDEQIEFNPPLQTINEAQNIFDDEIFDISALDGIEMERALFKEFVEEYEPSHKPNRFRVTIEIDDAFYVNQNNNEDNEQTISEDAASFTTKDDTFCHTLVDDGASVAESFLTEAAVDIDPEWRNYINNYLKVRTDEERAYIKEVFPNLIESVNELLAMNQNIRVDQKLWNEVIKDVLVVRETLIAKENTVIKGLVDQEMAELASTRPRDFIDRDNLNLQKRKNKSGNKNHKNHSMMNHMNENYVSNIFQFSKHYYPQDKEIQRLANTRNVSASNFKKLTKISLADTALARKGKVRILASGKELVTNIELWMKNGYFGQCTDREKYIYFKEKALTDLVLERRF